MCSISLPGQDILTYLQVTWEKITFFMVYSTTCLNIFGVKAVLKQTEKAHTFIILSFSWWRFLAKAVFGESSTSAPVMNTGFAMQEACLFIYKWQLRFCQLQYCQGATTSWLTDTGARARLDRKSCLHNLWPREKRGLIQPLWCQIRL